ncbi:MAG TPA: phosphatase PAP2 family protein [Deinococcales bacterium]|nr:phosphatase PAP2 family protein [Deinococcales bacterium]
MPPAINELDRAVAEYLQAGWHVPALKTLFGLTSSLLDLAGFLVLLALLMLALHGRRDRRLAALASAFLIAGLATLALKGLTGRPNVPLYHPYPPDPIGETINPVPVLLSAVRGAGANPEAAGLLPPPVREFLERAFTTSFPSGHATRAFALAVAAALLWPRWRWPLLLAAAWVGFSRAYIGAHWPLDVLAGAVLGTLIALAVSRQQRSTTVSRPP